jgi:hypothetical protein
LDKKEPTQLDLLSRLDATFSSSPPRFGSSSIPGSSSGNIRPGVKFEPMDSAVPQKRLSDVAFPMGDTTRPRPFPASPSPKKTKLEAPKTPLTQVDRNSFTSQQTPGLAIEQARERIRNTQDAISAYQVKLDRLRRKTRPSKADVSSIDQLTKTIRRLRREKDKLNATIPSMSPLKRVASDNKPLIYNPTASASGSNLQLPPAFNRPFVNQPQVVGQLPPANFIPSGSNVRLSDAPMDVNGNRPLNIMKRLEVAIPSVAGLPGPSDGLDENGDFHGRGRDTFRGPQAKADEYVGSYQCSIYNDDPVACTVSTSF